MSANRLDGLRTAVELSPENHPLRLVFAEALEEAAEATEALEQYATLLDQQHLPSESLTRVGLLAARQGAVELAAACLSAAESAGRG